MAIYHLNTRIVSRSKGHSAVAAAAYRARMALVDERTGKKWDYSGKSDDILFEGIFAPQAAPDWSRDRAELWNRAEQAEKRKDAQVARQFIVGLPYELTLEQQRFAVQDFVRENFTRRGYVADLAIHRPDERGDERNTHAHILVTMRTADGSGFALKKERTADPLAELEAWRESWELTGNRFLKRFGHEPNLDRRSLEQQGIDREPTIHLGQQANQMEREGIATDRGEALHNIQQKNEARALYTQLVPDEIPSAIERQRLEDRARQIAELRDSERQLKRGLGLPHHLAEIIGAIRSLSRTMGHALGNIVHGAEPGSRHDRALTRAARDQRRAQAQRIEPATLPAPIQRLEPQQRETVLEKLKREGKVGAVPGQPDKQPDRLQDEMERRRRQRRIEDEILPP